MEQGGRKSPPADQAAAAGTRGERPRSHRHRLDPRSWRSRSVGHPVRTQALLRHRRLPRVEASQPDAHLGARRATPRDACHRECSGPRLRAHGATTNVTGPLKLLNSPKKRVRSSSARLDDTVPLEHSCIPGPVAPDGLCLAGLDGDDGYTQHYFDSRGIAHVYAMTFDGRPGRRRGSTVRVGRGVNSSAPMAIFVRFLDGSDHRVKMQSRDEEKEIDGLLRGAGWPYEQGWIELEGKPPRYAALRHVLSVEIREASQAGASPRRRRA
jgi:hypothetical protein